MHHRIVLLHGWGANADDLRPVGVLSQTNIHRCWL